MLPERSIAPLREHLAESERRWRADLRDAAFGVELPGAFGRKVPSAARAWEWYWVFPASRTYIDRVTGMHRRHHLHETVVQKAVVAAAHAARIGRRVTCHSLRHNADCRIMPSRGAAGDATRGGSRARALEGVGIIRDSPGMPRAGRRVDSGQAVRPLVPCAREPALSSACRRAGTSAWSPRTRGRATGR